MSDAISMNATLAALRSMAQAAGTPGGGVAAADAPADGADFAATFKGALAQINATQTRATDLARAFELGDPAVDLSDVMVNLQKSRVVFQATMQVRNKLVAAYQDIMNMPI